MDPWDSSHSLYQCLFKKYKPFLLTESSQSFKQTFIEDNTWAGSYTIFIAQNQPPGVHLAYQSRHSLGTLESHESARFKSQFQLPTDRDPGKQQVDAFSSCFPATQLRDLEKSSELPGLACLVQLPSLCPSGQLGEWGGELVDRKSQSLKSINLKINTAEFWPVFVFKRKRKLRTRAYNRRWVLLLVCLIWKLEPVAKLKGNSLPTKQDTDLQNIRESAPTRRAPTCTHRALSPTPQSQVLPTGVGT